MSGRLQKKSYPVRLSSSLTVIIYFVRSLLLSGLCSAQKAIAWYTPAAVRFSIAMKKYFGTGMRSPSLLRPVDGFLSRTPDFLMPLMLTSPIVPPLQIYIVPPLLTTASRHVLTRLSIVAHTAALNEFICGCMFERKKVCPLTSIEQMRSSDAHICPRS